MYIIIVTFTPAAGIRITKSAQEGLNNVGGKVLPSEEVDSRLCVESEVSNARKYFCRHLGVVTTPEIKVTPLFLEKTV